MLVLNTNNSWWGAYELSNKFLWIYPDFENVPMIIPPLMSLWNLWQTLTPNNWTFVENVNWTKINHFSTWIVTPDYYTWVNYWDSTDKSNHSPSWLFSSAALGQNVTYSWERRIALWKKLSWWEIVWKKIIHSIPKMRICTWSSWSVWNPTFKTNVWLLHSDWTITSIDEKTFTLWQEWTMTWWYYVTWFWVYIGIMYPSSDSPSKIFEWSWVVAQEWDYIIETNTYNRKSPSSTYQWFLHWYKYTPNDEFRMDPTQISID